MLIDRTLVAMVVVVVVVEARDEECVGVPRGAILEGMSSTWSFQHLPQIQGHQARERMGRTPPSDSSPGLLDLHSFDTELLPEKLLEH
ncbi:hypothetical protein NL676_006763 [Syzygium grande]|nr:hypothetical protein NL676_006763 [Syzygium grande]